jgi:hypothetical protein
MFFVVLERRGMGGRPVSIGGATTGPLCARKEAQRNALRFERSRGDSTGVRTNEAATAVALEATSVADGSFTQHLVAQQFGYG